MLNFIPNKILIAAFLVFFLIAAFITVVNTQSPYPSSNFLESFTPLESFSYKPTAYVYSEYMLNLTGNSLFTYSDYNFNATMPSYHSYTYPAHYAPNPTGYPSAPSFASFLSYNPAGSYSEPFSHTNFSADSLQPFSSQFPGLASLSLFQNRFPAYQNQPSFNFLNYQPAFIQYPGNQNFNTPSSGVYSQGLGYMPSLLSGSYYSPIYYPGYTYSQNPLIWPPAATIPQQQASNIIGAIGMIGDVHYTDKNSTDRRLHFQQSGPRFYSEAGNDLTDFVLKMNSRGVDAAIELGDFVDVHSGNSLAEGNSNTHDDGAHGEAILSEAESIYSKLTMPYYHVIGNWDMCDYDFATASEWFCHIINGRPDTIKSLGGELYTDANNNPVSRYYSFRFGHVLGIALDSSGSSSVGENYLIHSTGINGTGYVPENQLNWLEGVLEENAKGENLPVILFIHPFLYPVFPENSYYMCRNHSAVKKILEADNNVKAVINSHHHPGAQGWWEDTDNDPGSNIYHTATGVFGTEYNGIKYFNLRASIIGWGSDSSVPIEKPSNVYYILRVKKGTSVSVEVETFSTN